MLMGMVSTNILSIAGLSCKRCYWQKIENFCDDPEEMMQVGEKAESGKNSDR